MQKSQTKLVLFFKESYKAWVRFSASTQQASITIRPFASGFGNDALSTVDRPNMETSPDGARWSLGLICSVTRKGRNRLMLQCLIALRHAKTERKCGLQSTRPLVVILVGRVEARKSAMARGVKNASRAIVQIEIKPPASRCRWPKR